MCKIIVIVGPTASGKTNLSIDIAKRIGSEIISADSLQVYKEFNICTSKPTENQLKIVKHHLIGNIPVSSEYSVFNFISEAKKHIEIISSLGKVPIIVGGTGLWIDALVNNFQFEKSKCNYELLDNNLDLYSELKKIDPISAQNINKNDHKRLSRAISFFKTFGFSICEQKNKTLKASKNYEVLTAGQKVATAPVWAGQEESVDLVVGETVVRTLRKNKLSKIKMTAVYDKPIKAPIAKGEPVGVVKIDIPGQPTFEVPLLAANQVLKQGFFGRIGKNIKYLLTGAH